MNVQKLILRGLLSLPPRVLVKMSGGTPVVRDGYELDAQAQFFAFMSQRQPTPDPVTPASVRAGTDLMVALIGGARETGVSVTEISIPTPAGALPARVYRPANQDPELPLLLFFHFGGGVVGNVGTCDAFCTILAKEIGCAVVSLEYRLAPEHKWPANCDDAMASYQWLMVNAGKFGAPAGRVAVGGDSMGGHMSAVLCHALLAAGQAQPFLQLLIYPAVDLTDRGGSMVSCADAFPLTSDLMAWFMMHYLPDGADPTNPALSPALAPGHAGLAPAMVVVAGHDPLRDQGLAYAQTLAAAGVAVQTRTYGRLPHGFTAMTGRIQTADAACREIAADLARAWRAMI